MARKTVKGKIRDGFGLGTGPNYKPWIRTLEMNSLGTTVEIVDWKHGRTVHLLSEGEAMWYYYLRWNDDVIDIREQYPLDVTETKAIAKEFGIKHPTGYAEVMTSDLLVTFKDGHECVYDVKANRGDVDTSIAHESERSAVERQAQLLFIHKKYWVDKGIPWKLVFKTDLDRQVTDNIRRCVEYYDVKKVHDPISAVKHLIAIKDITVDMGKPIDYQALIRSIKEDHYNER